MTWSQAPLDELPQVRAVTDSRAFLDACLGQLGGRETVLHSNGSYLPLVYRRLGGLTVVEGLGQDHRSQAGPVGQSWEEDMPAIETADLPEPADLVDLRRCPPGALDRLFPSAGGRLVRDDDAQYGLRPPAAYEDYYRSLSKKDRRDFQAARNRLERLHGPEGIVCDSVRLEPETWAQGWAKGAAVAPFSWQGERGLSIFTDPDKQDFLRRLAAGGLGVSVNTLCLGPDVAAAAVTVENRWEILMHSIEYSGRYAKFQPGHLLNLHLIRQALASGMGSFDFGYGASRQKAALLCRETVLSRVMVPLTWKGRLRLEYQKARWLAGGMARGVS